MELFREALETHREELNSLNVYPVPDGDTGTNLLLTQRAVTSALENLPSDSGLRTVATVVSRASLMGARGNSGVILSQVLRAICEALPTSGEVASPQLAAALEHAAYEAYRTVAKPAEGTMLSVLRDTKAAARQAARSDAECGAVLTASLAAARESLNRTKDVNQDLRRAGVVDAGGKGIVLLLDAMRTAVTDEPMTEPVGAFGPVGSTDQEVLAPRSMAASEVQYLLEGPDDALPLLREALQPLGESVVVVGGGGLFNVHVHTDEPDAVVRAGERAGSVRDVSVVSLSDQVGACIAGQARAVRVAEETSAVVVADGEGLVRAFESLGAVVVRVSPLKNPSVSDLVSAIHAAPGDAVLVLPNHRDVVPIAERAAAEPSKRTVVVPAVSIPSGLSAVAAFNPAAGLEENVRSMKEVLASSRSGELFRVGRGADAPSADPVTGDWIGVVEGEVVYTGPSVGDAASAAASRLVHRDVELLTLIVGSDAGEENERLVRSAVGQAHRGVRIEVLAGDQARPEFLMGVE